MQTCNLRVWALECLCDELTHKIYGQGWVGSYMFSLIQLPPCQIFVEILMLLEFVDCHHVECLWIVKCPATACLWCYALLMLTAVDLYDLFDSMSTDVRCSQLTAAKLSFPVDTNPQKAPTQCHNLYLSENFHRPEQWHMHKQHYLGSIGF